MSPTVWIPFVYHFIDHSLQLDHCVRLPAWVVWEIVQLARLSPNLEVSPKGAYLLPAACRDTTSPHNQSYMQAKKSDSPGCSSSRRPGVPRGSEGVIKPAPQPKGELDRVDVDRELVEAPWSPVAEPLRIRVRRIVTCLQPDPLSCTLAVRP